MQVPFAKFLGALGGFVKTLFLDDSKVPLSPMDTWNDNIRVYQETHQPQPRDTSRPTIGADLDSPRPAGPERDSPAPTSNAVERSAGHDPEGAWTSDRAKRDTARTARQQAAERDMPNLSRRPARVLRPDLAGRPDLNPGRSGRRLPPPPGRGL